MTKTSHKKNRPFDFKLIDLVQPHPVLYLRQISGMSTFQILKKKNVLWQQIAAEMGFPVQFCLNRWNNLRGQFQKELKRFTELCPQSGVIRGSTWPYLNSMKFLECTVQANKPKKEKLSKRRLKELQEMEEETVWKSEESESRHSEDIENEFNVEDISDQVQDTQIMQGDFAGDDYTIIEEIAEEIVGNETVEATEYGTEDTFENYNKMHTLLSGFEEGALQCIERRLMAFLCKCQLRSLTEQSIDDLFV